MKRIDEVVSASFIEDLFCRVEQQEPEAIVNVPRDAVERRVRAAVHRAMERGARSEAAIRRFVMLMFALEPEFDQRYRVREYVSSRSGSFDDAILGMHEWSHPNCWYRSERSFTEERWHRLVQGNESHIAPIVATFSVPSGADRPSQLSRQYGVQLDVPYIETPRRAVLSMLRIARVGAGDTVIDLGCGDGNVVIAAAALFGARAIGIDLDPDRISNARTNAKRQGVSDRVTFRRVDLFDTDISAATVVTLYLLHDINLALREMLQRDLPNGARIVSWQFDMGDWRPDVRVHEEGGTIYCWHVNETRQR